ncbi:hypothetical protein HPP92_017816 [Vanilla planifolia]|uniref:Uncharacterized protein n=1 Tax=Vanilla planifolia TaxID=51239 RepID=A0A835UNY3_VANPL|nr:hypothetical protein HPP92_018407 [Vanilla planifolia]KAG0468488.1 hypothetical protein HPP92_017816 [Vanilla planifolia]
MGTKNLDDRADGRTNNQLRPLTCSRNLLNRAHGSARWSQGETIVLAAVFGPKAGTKKGDNPEKASIEVIWKPKIGQTGRQEKECEMILRRTLHSICLLTVHPNTTTSVIVQVIGDDGALLPCAINASCAALVDAGIPLKYVAVAISCGLAPGGSIILDPTTQEEQEMEGIITLVFPNPPLSVLPKPQSPGEEHINLGVITSLACGVLSVADYERCLERGSAACIKISEFLRRGLQSLSREGSTSTT